MSGPLRPEREATLVGTPPNGPIPALPRPQQLALGVAAAVLAHGALLFGLRPAAMAPERSELAAPIMTVRLLAAPGVPERLPGRAATPAAAPDRPTGARPTAPEPPTPAPVPPGTSVATSAREASPPTPPHRLSDAERPARSANESAFSDEQRGRAIAAPPLPAAHAEAGGVLAAASAPATPTAVAALAPAPDYLAAGKLDPGPRPLQEIEPLYPEAAGMRSGSVVLRVLIGAAGGVDAVAVVRSAPPGLFDAAAMAAFASARFSPGLLLGAPVKSQITIQVDFTPINRGSAVSGRSD